MAVVDEPTSTFSHECADCGKPIRVVNGRERRHWCRMPRHLRGRVRRTEADIMRWTCEQAGHPRQHLDDANCICGTWARHIEADAVLIVDEGACDGW